MARRPPFRVAMGTGRLVIELGDRAGAATFAAGKWKCDRCGLELASSDVFSSLELHVGECLERRSAERLALDGLMRKGGAQ